MSNFIKTEVVDDAHSPYLEKVKILWRANSSMLGFFPNGAFEEHASRKRIIIALDEAKSVVGYILYRVTNHRATIVHLCVDNAFRGKGVARNLFDRLRSETKDLFGIGLRCRQDYEANKIWPKLYFVNRGEQSGKGKDGTMLTFWWYSHEQRTLFTDIEGENLSSNLCVVLDANVFFDLADPLRPDYEESSSLLAEWLFDVELCLTDEIYNEIDRNSDNEQKRKEREFAKQFTIYPCNTKILDIVTEQVRGILSLKSSESAESDVRQLSRAIAADIKFFVTRDSGLLNSAESIYKSFGVSVIRPSQFIIQLDELQRENEYQPARLAGVFNSHIRRVRSSEEELITTSFHCSQKGESKTEFLKKLRPLLANPQKYTCHIAVDIDGSPLVLIAYEVSDKPNTLVTKLFRVAQHKFANTLIRYFTLYMASSSAQNGKTFTHITDPILSENIITALKEDHFFTIGDGWIKANPAIAESSVSLAERMLNWSSGVGESKEIFPSIANALMVPNAIYDARKMSIIEHILWPAKITDAYIPTFIVPIRPEWAKELFDKNLAEQSLFGASKGLTLSRESVYYRSRNNSNGLRAPGRVLWYVSGKGKGKFSGEGQLRACSRLDEVVVAPPKELYRRFKRLGIYEWKHLNKIAKQNIENEIMAFRFSNTELFPFPINYEHVKKILLETDRRTQLQSPVSISPDAFSKLYLLASNFDKNQ